jgi:hypothetical protein
MIVISDFITRLDIKLGIDDDFLLSANGNDLCGAIWITRVIYQTPMLRGISKLDFPRRIRLQDLPKIPYLRGVHHKIIVYSE